MKLLTPAEIQLWQQVVIAVAGSSNAVDSSSMSSWADRAVLALRERLVDHGPPPDKSRL